MNVIVGIGFWLNWRDESKNYKTKNDRFNSDCKGKC